MNLKVEELYQIFYGLHELSNVEMTSQCAYRVVKNKKILIEELSIFDDLKREHLDDEGNVLDEGKINEINNTEVEISLLLIDIEDINKNITPALIELILPILKEEK